CPAIRPGSRSWRRRTPAPTARWKSRRSSAAGGTRARNRPALRLMIAPVGFRGRLAAGLVLACALCAAPPAFGAAPSNPKDPCVQGTRDSCGTAGVGFYKTYSYGTRWLGDFRNAIPGSAHSYCIDLRFWYPGPDYNYKEDSGADLVNKNGDAVPF